MVNRTSLRAFAVFAALGMLTAPSAVRAQLVGDFDRGRDLAATHCVACHGADGNGPVPSFPKIAGLHKEYTIKQLQEFRTQRRQWLALGSLADQRAHAIALAQQLRCRRAARLTGGTHDRVHRPSPSLR